jgi:hypothetical protein
MQTILVVGNSKKFISAIKKNNIKSLIQVVSWRELTKQQVGKDCFPIIFLVGFDFDAISESYMCCYKKNVLDVVNFLSNVSCESTIINYVNTIICSKRTFSRYAFAKAALADELVKRFKNVREFQCPTIVNRDEVYIRGGRTILFFAKVLIKTKIVKTIQLDAIANNFGMLWQQKKCFYEVEGRYLNVSRPLIVDKFLRVLLG